MVVPLTPEQTVGPEQPEGPEVEAVGGPGAAAEADEPEVEVERPRPARPARELRAPPALAMSLRH